MNCEKYISPFCDLSVESPADKPQEACRILPRQYHWFVMPPRPAPSAAGKGMPESRAEGDAREASADTRGSVRGGNDLESGGPAKRSLTARGGEETGSKSRASIASARRACQ